MSKFRIATLLLLISCKLFAQVPDSAIFIKTFNKIRPEIDKNFAGLQGELKAVTYFGKEYFVKNEAFSGTFKNYLKQMNSLFGTQPMAVYTAPIDSAISETSAASQLQQWKALLIKVFPKEATTMIEESGEDESKTHDLVFIHTAGTELDAHNKKYQSKGWMLILRDYINNYQHCVEMYIRQNK